MDRKSVIGIDLGGTKVSGALFDLQGMISPGEFIYLRGLRGKAVGDSRQRLEQQTGLKVITEQNYLPPKKKKD